MKVMLRVFSVVYCFLCLHIVPWFLRGHRDRKGSLVWILAQRQTDSQTMTFLLYKSIYLTSCWLPQLIVREHACLCWVGKMDILADVLDFFSLCYCFYSVASAGCELEEHKSTGSSTGINEYRVVTMFCIKWE